MPCITLSSGKTVCYGDDNTYNHGGIVLQSNLGYEDPRHPQYPDGGQTIKKGPGPFLIPESRPQLPSMPVPNRFDPRFLAYQDSARINQNSVRDLQAFNKAANNKQPYTTSAQTYDDNYNTNTGASKSTYTNPRNTKNHLNPSKTIQGLSEEQRQNFYKGFNTAENGTTENLPTALYSADVTNPAMYKDEQLWLPYHTNPVQPYHVAGMDPIASKMPGLIPNNMEHPLMNPGMNLPQVVGKGYTPHTEGITVPVPTVDIVKETAPPKVNAKRKQNRVNVGSDTKTKVRFGIDQRELMSRGDLDSLRESVGLEPKGYDDGGKTLKVKGSSFNIPKSQQQILAEQARIQGDMPTAPASVRQQERMREEAATKKRLSNQPTIRLSEAQKKAIAEHGLKEDLLAEQMMRNKQSLSNPDESNYVDSLGNVLYSAGQDIQDNGLMGAGNAILSAPTGLISGRYETPSQAIGRYALRNDHNMLRNAMIDDQGNPTGLGMVTDFALPIGLEQAVAKGISNAPTILNNAYKYNPWAYKPNPEAYYRGIGKSGFDDALQSGLVRPPEGSFYNDLYMSPDMNIAKDYSRNKPTWSWQEVESNIPGQQPELKQIFSPVDETSYIAEIPKSAVPNVWNTNKLVSTTTDKIPTEQVKLLKEHWLKGYKPVKVSKATSATETLSPPHQMGFINLKGAFQKYPKGKLTQEEIETFKNSSFYKETTKNHLDNVNKYGDKWNFPNYAEETLNNAIKTGDRSIVNHTLYGGNNWSTNNYILAGLMGTAYPGVASLYGLAFSPPVVRNKVLNSVGITNIPGTLSSNDTTINITNTPMDFAKVNETKKGKVILGGEFIEDSNNTVRKAKDWATAIDTYSDQKYPSKDIQSFYGIENGKFKVGKASEFKPETEIVPRRFGATNITKAILNGKAMRLLDNKGNPIYQNTPNTGKFILYSPSTKEAEFNYINTGKVGVDKVNKFLKKNKDAQYIHLDNGRYEFYGLNPGGLSDQDFINYYEQDLKRKGTPGYNMIIKKDGGKNTKTITLSTGKVVTIK